MEMRYEGMKCHVSFLQHFFRGHFALTSRRPQLKTMNKIIGFQIPIPAVKPKLQAQTRRARSTSIPCAARRGRQNGAKQAARRESIDLVPSERPLMRATWRGRVLAESREYEVRRLMLECELLRLTCEFFE